MGAMSPLRIALLAAALAAAMFLPVRDGVAGESDRALLPPVAPVFAACEEGECPSVVLCEPGSVWDARARTCRQVSFCPGDRKVQIPGGPCELYCRPGMEANPFDPNRCRPVVSCPQGTTEKADGVCEIACPDGRRENPYAPGTCRPAFFCPEGQEEVAEGECAARCGEGEERDLGGECRPIPPSAEFCARSGMAYNSNFLSDECIPLPLHCLLIEKAYDPFANGCVANLNLCKQQGQVYAAKEDKCVSPSDQACRDAGMFFHDRECVSVDPASCSETGQVYDSTRDQCAVSEELCGGIGKAYEPSENRCVFNAKICKRQKLIYVAEDDECLPATDQRCRDMGMFLYLKKCVSVDPASCPETGQLYYAAGDRCAANRDICMRNQKIYDPGADRCVVRSADSCGLVHQIYSPRYDQCVETCEEGTEPAGGACLNVCRNNDHNGRIHYDPRARPAISETNSQGIPIGTTRTGLCVCPPGPDGDACRELGRTHGATAVKLPFAHSLTLANGEFLLGQGVSVGVMEVGPLQWRDNTYGAVRTHSDLPSVKIFCGTDEGNNIPCYDSGDEGVADAFHGIAVLGILAAKKDGEGLAGVAPESDYLYAWYNYDPLFVYHDLVSSGASIINNSWTPEIYIAAHDFRPRGACGTAEACLEQARANLQYYARDRGVALGNPLHSGERRRNFAITVEVNELFTTYDHAAQRAGGVSDPADRPIYVWSAGNNNGRDVAADVTIRAADNSVLTVLRKGSVVTATSLAVIAGLPHYFPDMTLNNLAVAAVDEFREQKARTVVDGETLHQSPIASFSNPCGEGASSFCLAAPGVASYDWHTNAEFVEIALTVNNCDLMRTFFAGAGWRYRCANVAAHDDILTRLAAERLSTGLGSGFVLAPETEEFKQQEGKLPAGYDETQGTSFAAPMVSGALALMKSYFMLGTDCGAGGECGLGSHELTRRILATADRRGIYADASIYGSGLLDLKNALTPQGELRLLLGRSVTDSASHLLSQSALHPGAALGDSAVRALSGVRLAAFDEMNAPFPVFGDAVLSADDSAEEGGGSSGGSGRSGGSAAGASVGISREEASARVGLGF